MTTTPELDYTDPDVCLSLFIGDPNGGNGKSRTNGDDDDVDEPCSSCAQPLRWDRDARMAYCVNDWYHA